MTLVLMMPVTLKGIGVIVEQLVIGHMLRMTGCLGMCAYSSVPTQTAVIDKYLNAKLIFNLGKNDERHGQVIKSARDPKGDPIGHAHNNPLFDTCEYDVKFTTRLHEQYQANVIAENIYAQVAG
jgi:hypothetical protein